MESMPEVSVIVIGHNEAKNLEKCFMALNEMEYPRSNLELIFIDSNSTDVSRNIADKYADKCISLKSMWPTAGEAFNRGIIESTHDFVHITAGDIILDKHYLSEAIRTLCKRNDIMAVTGYFEEQNDSGWNKVIGYRRLDDVDTTEHFVPTPNGGTFRKAALVEINGYDERIKKGQETELGQRFAERGFKILYKHMRQGIHDFDIASTKQLLSRFFKDGQSAAYMVLLSLREKSNLNLRKFFVSGVKNLVAYSFLFSLMLFMTLLSQYLTALCVFPLYWAYLVTSVLIKNRAYPYKYKIYRLTMAVLAMFVYFGMISFMVRYFIQRLLGYDLIKPRVGLTVS